MCMIVMFLQISRSPCEKVSEHERLPEAAQVLTNEFKQMSELNINAGADSVTLHLLKVPTEIRDRVYAYLVDVEQTIQVGQSRLIGHRHNGTVRLKPESPIVQISTGIFRVNRQISAESLARFHNSNLFVRLSLHSNDISLVESMLREMWIPYVCTDSTLLSRLTCQALDAKIVHAKSKILRFQGVFSATYLPTLTEGLQTVCDIYPKWGENWAIQLSVPNLHNQDPTSIQSKLLEQWRPLHDISNVRVANSNIDPTFARDLEKSMMSHKFNPAVWLNNIKSTKAQGTKAFSNGDLEDALSYFTNLIQFLNRAFDQAHGAILATQGPEFSKAVNKVRLQCPMNVILCITKMDIRSDITYVCNEVVRITEGESVWTARGKVPAKKREWWSDADRAKTKYRKAQGLIHLGQFHQAKGELEDADRLSPGDPAIEKLLHKLRLAG